MGGATVFKMAEFIVCMWFFPVTIFIIIPLLMLLTWGVVKLIFNNRFTRILSKISKD